MFTSRPVFWYSGQFLDPQHFQAADCHNYHQLAAASAASFMKPLADWAGRGSPPLIFQYADGESTVPAFAGGAAHERVAALCAQWNNILAESGYGETELIVQSYEDMMFSQWRGTAEKIVSALASATDTVRPGGPAGKAHGARSPPIGRRRLASVE